MSDPATHDSGGLFDRQVERYVEAGYAGFAGLTDDELRAHFEPLRAVAAQVPLGTSTPFALVPAAGIVSPEQAMSLIEARQRPGYVDMDPTDPSTFAPIDEIDLPADGPYLIADVDAGDDLRDVTPADALERLTASGRSPLTIAEGLAFAVQDPALIGGRHYFSMAGSRSHAPGVAKSVPAIWVSRDAPRLGWCWNGNPHSWLGTASCASRHW